MSPRSRLARPLTSVLRPVPQQRRSPPPLNNTHPATVASVFSHARQTQHAPFSSSSKPVSSSDPTESPLPPPSRKWLTELELRIGRCLSFGCNREQTQLASDILLILATEWRELTVGSEGYLSSGRRGLRNQQVVWGEMDSFGHVNNANYIRWAESARVNFIMYLAGADKSHSQEWRELMTPKGVGLIMKSIKAEYKLPITYPDTISVYHKVRTFPEQADTSLILDCVVISHVHKRVAARTEEDIVVYDYAAAQKTFIPDFALRAFRGIWRQQNEESQATRARILGLESRVEALERLTWNKEGAVEDMGGR